MSARRYARVPDAADDDDGGGAGDSKDNNDDGGGAAPDPENPRAPAVPALESLFVNVPSLPHGKPLCLAFERGMTIGELKGVIARALRATPSPIPAARQRLAFQGRVLGDDGLTLAHVGVRPDSQLHVFPRPVTTAGPGGPASAAVPLATQALPADDTPVITGVVLASDPAATAGRRPREHSHRPAHAAAVLMQWAFRVKIFCLLMMFFYGFGLISNLAYWMGDTSMPDDREMVPGEAPSDLATPIYSLDFISNSLGLIAATLGLKSLRLSSLPVAVQYQRVCVLLVLVSAVQLVLEVYSFSERYKAARGDGDGPPAAVGGNETDSSRSGGKRWDDLAFTVSLNVMIRGLFWSLILRTAKHYVRALLAWTLANANNTGGNNNNDDRQAPAVPALARGQAVATAQAVTTV